jgi:Leucine-rich repeat (LRR) protein
MASSSSTRRQPPLRPSSSTNRTARGVEKRVNTPALSNDDEYGIANGKQIPRSYLLKLIKGSRRTGILNLASRGLTEVPGEIFLEEIVEDENQQRQKNKIPDFSQNETEAWWTREPLKTLDLSSNSLTTLPNQIETLDYLIVLNVQNNQLTTLPNSIRGLRALEKLVLSQNQLTTLSDGLFYCSSLLSLNLSRNHLSKLSNKIGDLSYLQELVSHKPYSIP